MFSKAETRLIRETIAPGLLSFVTDNGSATESVVLATPARWFGIQLTNGAGSAQDYRLVDGADTAANRKVNLGTLAVNQEVFFSIAPAWVRFATEIRLVSSAAALTQVSILYLDE
jgi:hypothetical protein